MDFSQPILPVDSSTSFRSASNMQTPPPTTTSASKRQGKQVQVGQADNEKGGSEKRRKSAPLLPKPTNNPNKIGASHASPDQFAGLEFSPDVFGPSFAAAPATAPADNQAKVFWDPQAVDSMSFDFTDLPFDTSRPGGLDPFVSNHPSISSSQATMQDSFLDFGNNDTPVASFSQSKLAPPNSQPGNMQNNTRSMHGVDPSLLFSSPGKLSDTINGSLPPGTSINQESLQPYAYQVQEARREREKAYGGVAKPKKRRKPSVDSPAVKAALETLREDGDRRPVVRRSMTDSVVSRHGQESGSSRTSSAHGRSSPLKRIKETRKSSRTPGHRTSIALTIDEHGRARAEARVIGGEKEGSEDAMDVDSVSTSSESSGESSSEPPGEEMVTSFAPQLPGPKMGRFSSSRAHSQKSSYTSFHSSMSYQDSQPSLPEIRPRPKSGSFANPLKTGSYTVKCRKDGKRITEDPESEAETVLDSDADEDNAKSQLRKVMQGRRSGSGPQPKHHLYSPLGISTAVFGSDNASSSISPTTITDPDLPTPTSSTSNQSDSIRCMCNSAMDEGQMIQWYSCCVYEGSNHADCCPVNLARSGYTFHARVSIRKDFQRSTFVSSVPAIHQRLEEGGYGIPGDTSLKALRWRKRVLDSVDRVVSRSLLPLTWLLRLAASMADPPVSQTPCMFQLVLFYRISIPPLARTLSYLQFCGYSTNGGLENAGSRIFEQDDRATLDKY